MYTISLFVFFVFNFYVVVFISQKYYWMKWQNDKNSKIHVQIKMWVYCVRVNKKKKHCVWHAAWSFCPAWCQQPCNTFAIKFIIYFLFILQFFFAHHFLSLPCISIISFFSPIILQKIQAWCRLWYGLILDKG